MPCVSHSSTPSAAAETTFGSSLRSAAVNEPKTWSMLSCLRPADADSQPRKAVPDRRDRGTQAVMAAVAAERP